MENDCLKTLQQDIFLKLSKLIDSDYIYLDLPYYENPGDILIWEGTEQFLSKFPYRCLYKASFQTYEHQELAKETIIFLQGGGNFGDLWNGPHSFRKKIVQEYPDNRIIILPQTVYYKDYQHAREDVPIFLSHKKLTICARDKRSYDFLRLYHMAKNILLVPDMAFCINPDSLRKYIQPATDKILFVNRKDKEAINRTISVKESIDVTQDWPTYEKEDVVINTLYNLIRERKSSGPEIDKFADCNLRPHIIQEAVAFISPYKIIYTTRLHVGILSVLLNKEITILDNSYGKNSQFYHTWLRSASNVHCSIPNYLSPFDYDSIIYALKAFFDVTRIRLGAIKRKFLC